MITAVSFTFAIPNTGCPIGCCPNNCNLSKSGFTVDVVSALSVNKESIPVFLTGVDFLATSVFFKASFTWIK